MGISVTTSCSFEVMVSSDVSTDVSLLDGATSLTFLCVVNVLEVSCDSIVVDSPVYVEGDGSCVSG